ncbi:ribonuclease H-like domain-containing protein [Immersiella caudata]|uniref:Ribonuclease H-like domain-containing protein n=1 Tax=Immersiella caudata TaxID=314043 RepID=A0AA39W4F8_9PEZI|nr:ribonuclease H-like domain-containing protein [Immersiella caudata]
MDPSSQFKALQESVQTALVTATRTVNGLANEDLQFQRTAHPSVGNHLDDQTQRILDLANSLLKSAGEVTGQKISALEDTDDIDIQWRGIVDNIDGLLEKADTSLDDYTGLIKRKDAPTPEAGRDAKRTRPTTEPLDWSLKRANILKPQEIFERKPDNLSTAPWKPLLTQKPHATVPLEQSLTKITDEEYEFPISAPIPEKKKTKKKKRKGPQDALIAPEATPQIPQVKTANWRERVMDKLRSKYGEMLANGSRRFSHPYETEIVDLEYPQAIYEKHEPIEYLPLESTEAIWVDTYEGVLKMLEELKNASEIAIDLEHHDYRTYTGILSLMQISTREKDWIVDTLVPWRHKLEVLNEVFADPKIVKVLHGAKMDIIWLQRDLGLYVVGLFDTYHAVDVLGTYPGKGLAALLKKFVGFDADKRYQLADWRIRPLDEKMLHYARCDTHFLLYVYDKLRNELLGAPDRSETIGNCMEMVLQQSKETSLQRYTSSGYNQETGQGKGGWFGPLTRSNAAWDGEQFSVFKAVHKWRDDLARQEDESTLFIMSPTVQADVAQYLPADKKALWALLGNHTRSLKGHIDDLFSVIQKAKVAGRNGPTVLQFLREMRLSEGHEGQVTPVTAADATIPPVSQLRTKLSQLWGNMAMSTRWEGSGKAVTPNDQEVIVFSYPQPVHAEFGSSPQQEQEAAESPSGDLPAANEPQPETLDQEFTLKAGRKRKIDDETMESASDAEEAATSTPASTGAASAAAPTEFISMEDDDESLNSDQSDQGAKEEKRPLSKEGKVKAKANKEARRARKLAKRQARKEKEAASKKTKGEGKDEEPFDYSKAPSVLHASKANGGKGDGGKGKKTFNPYSKKSGDAPKGERRLGLVKSGKTATFKK